jgi:decaprenyl-phosphate phosphoribosyltransferase
MSTARAILVTLRPQQWIKNLFVVAPLVFSKNLFAVDFALRTAAATAVFCALSGAVYAFNDLRDAEADRQHATKCNRPIAAGLLSERAALATALILTVLALSASLLLSWRLAAAAATYATINLAYSLGLKRISFIDVGLIAAGFLLRVAAGAFAIAVPISPWLLACTGVLAMMLGFGKRMHELLAAEHRGRDPAATRASLRGYSVSTLRLALIILALATCAAYALYTRDQRTIEFFATDRLFFTLPFIFIGIGRFLQLAMADSRRESPTDAIVHDWPFLLNIAVWGATVLFIIYGG